SLPIALAPRVVVLHVKADHGWTVVVLDRLAKSKEERVPGVDGQIHLAAHDQVLLRVVLVDAVDKRTALEGGARVESGPEVVIERIADVSFEPSQRVLPQDLPSMEPGVVRVEVPVDVEIELPLLFGTERLR